MAMMYHSLISKSNFSLFIKIIGKIENLILKHPGPSYRKHLKTFNIQKNCCNLNYPKIVTV